MKKVVLAGAMVAAVGCGSSSDVGSSDAPIPTSTQSASFPDGIYVAAYSGLDDADGSPTSPVRSINAAIRKARDLGKTDVYVYGGGLDGAYPEVVVVQNGIHLHGAVCRTPAPPLETDRVSCPTTIRGGSPTLVAQDIVDNTLIERFEILALPGVQSGASQTENFFEVPGVGCIGHGARPEELAACTPAPDAEGRPVPQSSVAMAVANSSRLVLQDVRVEAARGADGLAGAKGAMGANGLPGVTGGTGSGEAWFTLPGGAAGTNPSCPLAQGGAGGMGGRFAWNGQPFGTPDAYVENRGFAGVDGMSSPLGAARGLGGRWYWNAQKGEDATAGADGVQGADGIEGFGGASSIDPATLVASSGVRGNAGAPGVGGAGGGGGGPGTRTHLKRTSTSAGWSIFAIGGANGGSTHTYESTVGATTGGSGSGGGAGGCGGQGGQGGQGGAASIGIYLVDSVLRIGASQVVAGNGGNGAAGGFGGDRGIGADGGSLSSGTAKAPVNVSGTWQLNAASFGGFTFSASIAQSSTDGKSASQGGFGGRGGRGGNGGVGGIGGGGAGGASVAVMLKGESSSVPVDGTTLSIGVAGLGGGEGEAMGANGFAMTEYAVENE